MSLSVLIVDDELLIRKGIIAKIDWQNHGFYRVDDCGDSLEAIEKFRETTYDMVISDIRMPEVDGLTMIRRIKELKPDCKFCIISGYAEFDYAKKALEMSVQHYLLKPIEPEELNTAVTDMVKEIRSDNRLKEISRDSIQIVNRQKTTEVDAALCSLIYDKADHFNKGVLVALLSEFQSYRLAVLQIDTEQDHKHHNSMHEVRAAVEKFLNDKKIYVFRNLKETGEFILLICYHHISDTSDNRADAMKKMLVKLRNQAGVLGVIGVSEGTGELSCLWQLYYQASVAVREKIVSGYGMLYTFKDVREDTKRFLSKHEYSRIFLDLLEKREVNNAFSYIDSLLKEALKNNKLSFITIKDLYEFVYRCMKEYLIGHGINPDKVIGERYDFSDELLKCSNLSQVQSLYRNIILLAIENSKETSLLTGDQVVAHCVQFIKDNLHEDINLSFIADKYHINPNY
ncbi:MAG: response regulator, partial [Clostridia bacterium]|nr:response regulator [Clostridia bacterium]